MSEEQIKSLWIRAHQAQLFREKWIKLIQIKRQVVVSLILSVGLCLFADLPYKEEDPDEHWLVLILIGAKLTGLSHLFLLFTNKWIIKEDIHALLWVTSSAGNESIGSVKTALYIRVFEHCLWSTLWLAFMAWMLLGKPGWTAVFLVPMVIPVVYYVCQFHSLNKTDVLCNIDLYTRKELK